MNEIACMYCSVFPKIKSVKHVMIGEAFLALFDSCGMYSHVENTVFLVSVSLAHKIKEVPTVLSSQVRGLWPLFY